MENGTTISNSLNANKVNQQFETPRRVFQIEQRHSMDKRKTYKPQNALGNTHYSL
jgi:hypothetical protein